MIGNRFISTLFLPLSSFLFLFLFFSNFPLFPLYLFSPLFPFSPSLHLFSGSFLCHELLFLFPPPLFSVLSPPLHLPTLFVFFIPLLPFLPLFFNCSFPFWAADPKGTKSCRTQGESVSTSVHLSPPLGLSEAGRAL